MGTEAAGQAKTDAIATATSAEAIERELAQIQGKDLQSSRGSLALASQGVVLNNLQDAWRFATIIQSTGLAPKDMNTPAKILLAMQMGMEVGLPPMASIQNIAVINGRPSLWGDVCLGLCRKSGLFDESAFTQDWEYDPQGNAIKATCTVRRLPNGQPIVSTFTWEEAKAARLDAKDTYKNYRKRMLMNRARAFALRDGFSDVLKGVTIAEEAQDLPERNITPTPPASAKPESLDDLTETLQASQQELDRRKAQDDTMKESVGLPAESITEPTPAEELAAVAGESDDYPITAIKQSIADCKYVVEVNKVRALWCGASSKLTEGQKFEVGNVCDARLAEIKNKGKKAGGDDQGSLV